MKGRLFSTLVLVVLLVGMVLPSAVYADNCKWHSVKRGQNLTQISRYYGVSVSSIVRANGIKNPSLIYRGQRLCIPTKSSQSSNSNTGQGTYACTKTHVVKRGEYVKLIALNYGVSEASIVRANGLSNPNRIYVGQRLKIPVRCVKPAPKPSPQPSPEKPWRGEYWTNRDQAGGPKFIRYVKAVDMNWGTGGPPDLGVVDNFSMRWIRDMHFDGGRYLFHVKAKDGIRVLVDGQMLIDQWHEVPYAVNYTAERDLSPGTHKIRVDYFAGYGPAMAHLQIEPIGGPKPPQPGPGGWNAEYWNNTRLDGAPAFRTTYRDVVFDWGRGSPHSGIAADFFSARYNGDFDFGAGKYRFYAVSDDGVRVWVDGNLIIDQWNIQAKRTFVSDIDLSEGKHHVKVEYFENTGVAALKVLWSRR
jgi:LysM repeat protein